MGCIPTKALVRSAEAIHTARRGAEFGFHADVQVDFPRIVERKNALVATVRGGLERGLEQNEKIELVRGFARFEAPDRISVDGRALDSERIIVASGVEPHIPDIPGLAEVGFLTNETVMDIEELPARLIVLGGGAEGLEFGQAFHRFGSRVTIVHRNRRLAPKEDPEISGAIEEILNDEGLEILTGTAPTRVERRGAAIVVETDSGRTLEGDALLVSTGRKPHQLADLGIDAAGIEGDPERGITIDGELRTTAPGVFAIGDVLGRVQHTHFATYTAGIAVANALAGGHRRYSSARVPARSSPIPRSRASASLRRRRRRRGGR